MVATMENNTLKLTLWYLAGVLLLVSGYYRWNIPLLAWFASVPFLIVISSPGVYGKFRNMALLFLIVQIAYNLQVLKIISDPIPWFVAILYATPMATGFFIILVIWQWINSRSSAIVSLLSWVALATISDWISIEFSSFGMWGTAASSQTTNLTLLQLVSITGITGITAVMALVSGLCALIVQKRFTRPKQGIIVVSATVSVVSIFGQWRLNQTQDPTRVKAASITTDLHLEGNSFPDAKSVSMGTGQLFERSKQAADEGARLIVWNEGATLVFPDQESALINRATAFSVENGVDLVIAYLVVLDENSFRYDNKYVWATDKGEVTEEYSKHFPVPGEPMEPGKTPITVLDRPYANMAGAICYDYDFPKLARTHSQLGADIVVVPSSDWRGIDSYHSEMARIRAIEGGFSVLRPARWSQSSAFDSYGRLIASADYFSGERVLLADIPTLKINTIYSQLGDWPAYLAILFLGSLLLFQLVFHFVQKTHKHDLKDISDKESGEVVI